MTICVTNSDATGRSRVATRSSPMKHTASRRSLKLRRAATSTENNHHQLLTTAQMAKRMGAEVWNVQKLKRWLRENRTRSRQRKTCCPAIVIHDLTGHFSPLAHEFRKDKSGNCTVPQMYVCCVRVLGCSEGTRNKTINIQTQVRTCTAQCKYFYSTTKMARRSHETTWWSSESSCGS